MKPVWSYTVSVRRERHPKRGYAYDRYLLKRDDGKIVASNKDPAVIAATKARFESWACQPWDDF